MIGTTLSHFKITAKLGEGGMGEVYRAYDTKLDRDVALKVLPEAFTSDPDRLARFEREAKVLASLNHPNIGHIYGLEEADGQKALVLELVEGPTLADRIANGLIPLDEALPIAKQIAEALESAHELGVIHRDLKPANIKVRPDGTVKVLDFGLAKAFQGEARSDPSESPTVTAAATRTGVILGTAAYMAPEQAKAQAADKRADVWAFGVVLYEMLTGRRAFEGGNASEVMAGVIKSEPDWTLLPTELPLASGTYLRRCLQKDPRQRIRDIGDVRLAMAGAFDQPTPPTVELPETPVAVPQLQVWQRPAAVATMALCTAAALALAVWGWLPTASEDDPIRMLDIDMPDLSRISSPVIEPSAKSVIFEGNGQLWRRNLDELRARPLAGTEGARKPFWSPDGAWVGFFIGREVYKVPINGGEPVRISAMDRDCSSSCGGSWTDDGRVLMSSGFAGVLWAPESGGKAESFLDAGADEHFHEVVWLRGESVAVVVDPDLAEQRIDVWNGSVLRTAVEAGAGLAYDPAGFLLYDGEGGVWSVPVEPESEALVGDPSLVIPGARGATAAENGSILITVPGEYRRTLAWVDRDGAMRQSIAPELTSVSDPDLAPDHNLIAVVNSDGAGRNRVWIVDPELGPEAPLAPDLAAQAAPVWGADSRTVYYSTFPAGSPDTPEAFIRKQVIGIGFAETVVESGYEPEVSRDGNYLVWQVGDTGSATLHYRQLDSPEDSSALFAAEPGIRMRPRLSPDGKFVAFLDSETGPTGLEVYVSRFPGGEDRVRVSSGGATVRTSIRWDDSGRRLYYVRDSDGTMMEVGLSLGDTMAVSPPRELFAERDSGLQLVSGFDVNRDGSRFLVVREQVRPGATGRRLVLVENWRRARLDDR